MFGKTHLCHYLHSNEKRIHDIFARENLDMLYTIIWDMPWVLNEFRSCNLSSKHVHSFTYTHYIHTQNFNIIITLQLELYEKIVRANCFAGVNMVIHLKCVLATGYYYYLVSSFWMTTQQCISRKFTDFRFNEIISNGSNGNIMSKAVGNTFHCTILFNQNFWFRFQFSVYFGQPTEWMNSTWKV